MTLTPEGIYIDGVESLPEVDDIRIRMPSGKEYTIAEVVDSLTEMQREGQIE